MFGRVQEDSKTAGHSEAWQSLVNDSGENENVSRLKVLQPKSILTKGPDRESMVKYDDQFNRRLQRDGVGDLQVRTAPTPLGLVIEARENGAQAISRKGFSIVALGCTIDEG
ncbi:hypothetical protein Ancab_011036 [Ancistrocladus abbreviatus]